MFYYFILFFFEGGRGDLIFFFFKVNVVVKHGSFSAFQKLATCIIGSENLAFIKNIMSIVLNTDFVNTCTHCPISLMARSQN